MYGFTDTTASEMKGDGGGGTQHRAPGQDKKHGAAAARTNPLYGSLAIATELMGARSWYSASCPVTF